MWRDQTQAPGLGGLTAGKATEEPAADLQRLGAASDLISPSCSAQSKPFSPNSFYLNNDSHVCVLSALEKG